MSTEMTPPVPFHMGAQLEEVEVTINPEAGEFLPEPGDLIPYRDYKSTTPLFSQSIVVAAYGDKIQLLVDRNAVADFNPAPGQETPDEH